MNKFFSGFYIILIIASLVFGAQMFLERGAGIIDGENMIIGILFIIGLSILSYTHYLLSRSVSPQTHGVLSTFSTLSLLLAVATIFSYTFGRNHGDLFTYMLMSLLILTLVISGLISIKILVKKQF